MRRQTPKPNYDFEKSARDLGYHLIAGVDEAGRGPLAGPVVAAACQLPFGLKIPGVNDSKKLTQNKREQIYETLIHHPEISFGVGIVEATRIDEINILQATFEAMLLAISLLAIRPHFVLIDGSLLPKKLDLPGLAVVGGDGESMSIACASILAKVTRDRLMEKYHLDWPHYNFKQHKGYGTKEHLENLSLYGPCPIHRLSFSSGIKTKDPSS